MKSSAAAKRCHGSGRRRALRQPGRPHQDASPGSVFVVWARRNWDRRQRGLVNRGADRHPLRTGGRTHFLWSWRRPISRVGDSSTATAASSHSAFEQLSASVPCVTPPRVPGVGRSANRPIAYESAHPKNRNERIISAIDLFTQRSIRRPARGRRPTRCPPTVGHHLRPVARHSATCGKP